MVLITMKLINAFILATAWAYLACAIFTILGKPPLVNVSTRLQLIFYLGAFSVFSYVSVVPANRFLNLFLGGLYGFAAMGSFIGWPQKWCAYWKLSPEEGSAPQQVMMATWDLAVAVAFLSLI